MRIQLLSAEYDQSPRPVDLTWEQLVAALTTTPKHEFNKAAWMPAELSQQARGDKNVLAVQCLVLDFDDLTVLEWNTAREKLNGISHCWHSTRSHKPVDGQLRYRAVLQLSRPVAAAQWKAFWAACVKIFGASSADPKCKNPERIFYLPCKNAHAFESGSGQGVVLPVDTIMLHAAPTPAAHSAHNGGAATEEGLRQLAAGRAYGDFQEKGKTILLRLLNKERPYAQPGERDEALYAVAMFCARRAHDRFTPESIADVLAPEVDWAYEQQPGSTNSAVLRYKLDRAWAEVGEALAGEDAVRMGQLNRSGPYTVEEVSAFVAKQGVSSAQELSAQLIVKHFNDLYAFKNGDYRYSGSEESGQDLIRQNLRLCTGTLGVVLTEMDPKGGYKDTSWKVLKQRHGFAVENVVQSLAISSSYIDRSTNTLRLAARPRRPDLVPAYDPAIEEWLGSWGDDLLLDWLATAARLDKATSALFLHGIPKSGKDMFTNGLAAMWGKAPTSMDAIGEQWNDALTECPVVFANETLPDRYRRDSGLLRKLITATSVSMNQKYKNTTTLEGSVRVIIAKNNLNLFSGGEAMSRDDVDAICERLLYYRMSEVKAPFFHPVRFAQHVLWLEDTRGEAARQRSGDRLWVEGRDSALHRHMRISSRDRSLVCQWLMAFIKRPAVVADLHNRQFRIREGSLRVNPNMIYERWDQYLGKERQMGLHQISQVCAELGVPVGDDGLYEINLDDLVQWGQAHSQPHTLRELAIFLQQAQDTVARGSN